MTASDLLIERLSSGVVVFRINRPEVRNALNIGVRTRLADEITRFGADADTRCLIVTGSEAAFAAGADIGEMAEAGPVEVMSRNVQRYWRALMDCPFNAPLNTALMLERKAFQLQFATRDQKEGMRAFIEKRKPKFQGK